MPDSAVVNSLHIRPGGSEVLGMLSAEVHINPRTPLDGNRGELRTYRSVGKGLQHDSPDVRLPMTAEGDAAKESVSVMTGR